MRNTVHRYAPIRLSLENKQLRQDTILNGSHAVGHIGPDSITTALSTEMYRDRASIYHYKCLRTSFIIFTVEQCRR